MKKFLVAFMWISLVLVMSSCSMESQYNSEGHQYTPEGVEKKH
jgi:hypothetical protein